MERGSDDSASGEGVVASESESEDSDSSADGSASESMAESAGSEEALSEVEVELGRGGWIIVMARGSIVKISPGSSNVLAFRTCIALSNQLWIPLPSHSESKPVALGVSSVCPPFINKISLESLSKRSLTPLALLHEIDMSRRMRPDSPPAR